MRVAAGSILAGLPAAVARRRLGLGAAVKSKSAKPGAARHRGRRRQVGIPRTASAAAAGLRQRRQGHPDRGDPGLRRSAGAGSARRARRGLQLHDRQRPRLRCYRRPYGTDWEDLDLDAAMDMIQDRVITARQRQPGRHPPPRSPSPGLGGATLERSRIPWCRTVRRLAHADRDQRSACSPPSPVWGWLGHSLDFQQIINSDCILMRARTSRVHGWAPGDEAEGRGLGRPRRPAVYEGSPARLRRVRAEIRPGPTSFIVGGLRDFIPAERQVLPRLCVAYTNAATIVTEESLIPRTSTDLSGLGAEALRFATSRYGDEDITSPAADTGRRFRPPDPAGGRRAISGNLRRAAQRRGTRLRRRGGRNATASPTRRCSIPAACWAALKRHFARYTPELVQEVGVAPIGPPASPAWSPNWASNKPRRSCSLGWSPGARSACSTSAAAAILQAPVRRERRPSRRRDSRPAQARLVGMRTDIPDLFDLLPGYLPMQLRRAEATWTAGAGRVGAASLGEARLLTCWRPHGSAASARLLYGSCRLTGRDPYDTVLAQLEGHLQKSSSAEPGGRVRNTRMQRDRHRQSRLAGRAGRRGHDRERDLVEEQPGDQRQRWTSARGAVPAGKPPPARKSGSFTNTERMLQIAVCRRSARAMPAATCSSSMSSAVASGRSWPPPVPKRSTGQVLDLTCRELPTVGMLGEPDSEPCWPRSTVGTPAASRCRPTPRLRPGRPGSRPLRLLDLLRCPRRSGLDQAAAGEAGARSVTGMGLGVGQPEGPLQQGVG